MKTLVPYRYNGLPSPDTVVLLRAPAPPQPPMDRDSASLTRSDEGRLGADGCAGARSNSQRPPGGAGLCQKKRWFPLFGFLVLVGKDSELDAVGRQFDSEPYPYRRMRVARGGIKPPCEQNGALISTTILFNQRRRQ